MTNCRIPKPDWQIIARSITVENNKATTRNAYFKLLGVPIVFLPYLSHPVELTGRQSGFLIPVVSNSTIKGLTVGEQVYIVLNRSMDMVLGTEYYSKRGFAPNGDFRYKGPGLDHFTARWNALYDRGVKIPPSTQLVNQGGADILADGRVDLTPSTRAAANVEYLSSYVYKLVFNDNYQQAVSSQVHSTISLTHVHDGLVPSAYLERVQNFASSNEGDEVRILHLPTLRFDVVDEPLHTSPFYWRLGSSVSYLGRSEYSFHVRNMGRFDLYPHLSLPLVAAGWSIVPEIALRHTFYTTSQIPDLTGTNAGTPTVSHDPLSRSDAEASLDIRPPAFERDFTVGHRILRHVVEPELTYRFVGGIGHKARNVPLIDPSDIATNTNEIGYSVIQRFYTRPLHPQPCGTSDEADEKCQNNLHEWASWQIAQKYFFDSDFGGAIIPGRRNLTDTTLDLTGIAFLTNARNHVGRDVVINLDLKDFFPTLTYARVKGLFEALGYAEAVAIPLALLCTEPMVDEVTLDGERHFIADGPRLLPQGAPTSPAITNLICRRLDRRLVGLARTLGFIYSRYADDLTFSGSGEAVKKIGTFSRVAFIRLQIAFAVPTVTCTITACIRPVAR